MEHQVTINGKEYTLTLDLGKFFRITQKDPEIQIKLFTGGLGPYGTLELFAQLADVSVNSIVTDPEFKLVHLSDYEYAILEVLVPFFKEQGLLPEEFDLPEKDEYYKMAEQVVTAELVKKLSL